MNKANNFSITTDKETIKQFKDCYSQNYVKSAALMPDAHRGYAAPIGAVLATKDFIVPAWVGFDIGCGVLAMQLKGKNLIALSALKSKQIYKAVSSVVPLGKGQKSKQGTLSKETLNKFNSIFENLKTKVKNKQILNTIKTMAPSQLGTLGGGNHFLELGTVGDETWLIVHSGSRALGHNLATHYMKIASKGKNIEQSFPLAVDSEIGKEYLAVQDFCLQFALLNRKEMALRAARAIEKVLDLKIKTEVWVNNHHNHVVKEGSLYVHRKGATPAHKNERGVIPANMRDGVLLVLGKGNKKFLYSSSHGAGRVMSRKSAKQQFTLADLALAMKGITHSSSEDIIDEIPMAYKDIHAVMSKQSSSVSVVKHIHTLINWKGTEKGFLD
ncbi:MAG TPA: RtcB family protein [Candidatus Nanoarchaeia archaeon]|nr:RtcB family protein [Candidatus Nanoarchaeia archaeon]